MPYSLAGCTAEAVLGESSRKVLTCQPLYTGRKLQRPSNAPILMKSAAWCPNFQRCKPSTSRAPPSLLLRSLQSLAAVKSRLTLMKPQRVNVWPKAPTGLPKTSPGEQTRTVLPLASEPRHTGALAKLPTSRQNLYGSLMTPLGMLRERERESR
jgi:hypothetical protein